jgi:hypothetical protein
MGRVACVACCVVALALGGCPSFPDPVEPSEDSGGQVLPDLLEPDSPPILPDAPQLPDTNMKNKLGEVCGVDGHCQSEHCADYTCCDTACEGTCEACNLTGSVGTCTPVPEGEDPRHDCIATPKETCGDDGECDGQGACGKWGPGTLCDKPSCSTSSYKLSSVKECDGKGNCVSAPDIDCSPFSCDSSTDQCYTSCNDSNESYTCQGWYGCDTSNNTCYTTCSSDNHCQSGGDCKSGSCRDKDS